MLVNFFKAFETEGGKMFLMIFLLVFILGGAEIANLKGHPLQEKTEIVLSGFVGALSVALLEKLKWKGETK